MRLAVWNVNTGADSEITLELSKWLSMDSKLVMTYPPIKELTYDLSGTELTVKLPKKNSALYLEIKR